MEKGCVNNSLKETYQGRLFWRYCAFEEAGILRFCINSESGKIDVTFDDNFKNIAGYFFSEMPGHQIESNILALVEKKTGLLLSWKYNKVLVEMNLVKSFKT